MNEPSQAVLKLHAATILREAMKLPWHQGSLARNRHGDIVEETNPTAVSFCMLGSIFLCANNLFLKEPEISKNARSLALEYVLRTIEPFGYFSIACYNDDQIRSREQIQKRFSEAIDLLTQEAEQHLKDNPSDKGLVEQLTDTMKDIRNGELL